jgi:hypothetical protein
MTSDNSSASMTLTMSDVKGIQRDVFRQQMLALAEPGLRRGEHKVAGAAQPVRDPAPAPSAMPGAVNQHEGLRRGRRLFRHAVRSRRRTRDRHCLQNIAAFHDNGSLVDLEGL